MTSGLLVKGTFVPIAFPRAQVPTFPAPQIPHFRERASHRVTCACRLSSPSANSALDALQCAKHLRARGGHQKTPMAPTTQQLKALTTQQLKAPTTQHTRTNHLRCKSTLVPSDGPLAEESRVLVTFDVDGTLVRSVGTDANKLHKRAFSYAFKELFGVDGTIDAIKVLVKHHGSTDKLVAVNTLEHYGIPKELSEPRIEEIVSAMVHYAEIHSKEGNAAEGLELLPGVHRLLTTLHSLQPKVAVGLVTGNLEQIAWIKMAGLGIVDLFSEPRFGGFGSDHVNRGELVKVAAARAAERVPGPPFRLHVHVGDTPNDVIAAEYGGARPLGLCTGIFKREDLEGVMTRDDGVILKDVQDVTEVLRACGLYEVSGASTSIYASS